MCKFHSRIKDKKENQTRFHLSIADLEFAFNNVFLMDRLKELQTDEYTEESDPESWNSGQISRKNRNEEIQRILNLMRNKGKF